MKSLISFDRKYRAPVLGIDEVGTGCVAGPAFACGVVIPDDQLVITKLLEAGAHDSKSISESVRRNVMDTVHEYGVWYYLGKASAREIEQWGLTKAIGILFNMIIHTAKREVCPKTVLLDGQHRSDIFFKHTNVIKGDTKSLAIAVASVVAKCHQVSHMNELALDHPNYGFEQHHGYLTAKHKDALEKYGVVDCHRRNYKPIRRIIESRG